MTENRSGGFVRFVRGFWHGVDASRRFVFNLLFLLLLLFVLIVLFSDGPVLHERTALVLAPQGRIVEQFSSDPVQRALARAVGEDLPETQLRDILRALERAAEDERIERLVIVPDYMTGAGYAALREIGAAIRAFRESGKQVVAYADSMSQEQYYLAAFADEIYMHPSGGLLLEGLGRYRNYYREGLQDKLGVDVHLFRVGEFKSAAEPYILDGPSEESRQADLFWMGDLWQRYLADIGAARGIEPASLQADIDAFDQRIRSTGGDLAALAVEQKLVDTLIDEAEFRQLMIERGVLDEDEETFRQVSLEGYLGFLGRERLPFDARPQVAVVVAQGEIVDGEQPPGTVGGRSTSQLLRDAREDENVEAVVLRVDSPGGGVFPSEQIRREVARIKDAGKPVVVSMGNVAASGGYWISMNADAIYANESTITGSIGIFGLFFTVPDTLAKIGVRTDGVGTTRLAGAIDPRLPLRPMVADIVQAIIDDGYEEFVGKVADARGQSVDQIDAVARGRVWSGAQAKERGLVDAFGGVQAAIDDAARRAGLEEDKYGVRYMERELSPFEQLLVSTGDNALAAAAIDRLGVAALVLGEDGVATLARDLALLRAPSGRPFRAAAFCFCEL